MSSVLPEPDEYAALAPKPGGPVWRAFNDVRMLGTSSYATLLQVAHPTVGAGVHQYSGFTRDPWGRLFRTLDYVHGSIYGGPQMAGEIGRRVRNVHRTIRGTLDDGSRYSAMEPDAFAWVHATLVVGAVAGYEHFARPLSWAEQQALWTEWLGVGRYIGIRERDLPTEWGDVQGYVDRVVEDVLVWTPAVADVLATFDGAPPPGVPGLPDAVWRVVRRPLSANVRLMAAGLMSPVLREKLGLPFTRRHELAFGAACAATRASGPVLRGPLREFGQAYIGWRREALVRGDVAAAPPVKTAVAA